MTRKICDFLWVFGPLLLVCFMGAAAINWAVGK